MVRIGNQDPSYSNVTYENTLGHEAITLYAKTTQTLMEWQQRQVKGIMALNDDGLWLYMKYCICVSRRNGKGEILAAREFDGLVNLKEKICHTAHRTTTSHDAFVRLYTLLKKAGYEEHSRKQKEMPERSFFASKQYGLEHIEVTGGGIIDFRTRTNNGGLGEGFDLLVIDEAQEYTTKQESALKYTVSASQNPQIILVGTPPTAISGGDVFVRIRQSVIEGKAEETGWAEWSIDEQTDHIDDVELWYKFNPSLGLMLTERNIRAELSGDPVDFNIQRLGLWLSYNQKSAIARDEWECLRAKKPPILENLRYFGIKYGRDGTNVAMSVASKTKDGHVFVEVIDCRPIREGNAWMYDFFKSAKFKKAAVDGAGGQNVLVDELKKAQIKNIPVMPTVKEIVIANAMFEKGIFDKNIVHAGQAPLRDIVTNCEKRPIGSNGGFGYKSLIDSVDVAVMDSVILAYWLCATAKEQAAPQAISY